jgi:hypothetical protein
LADAETALRSGWLDAEIDYADGGGSTAKVLFDLGGEGLPARLYFTSGEGAQAAEFLTIGEQSWRRQPRGRWAATGGLEGVWGQVQAFLPRARSAAEPRLADGTLHWEDRGRDAEVTVRVDPDSGIPRELRRVDRTGGAVLRVTYHDWNQPVEIGAPPEG